jgi:hypothetical protein
MKTFTIEPTRSAASCGTAESDNPKHPDKAAVLKATHEAAGLKRLLDERIKLADAPEAVWHDAADVFAEMEALNAS